MKKQKNQIQLRLQKSASDAFSIGGTSLKLMAMLKFESFFVIATHIFYFIPLFVGGKTPTD